MSKRNEKILLFGSLALAGFFLLFRIGSQPLVDYDEAYYASVVRDTGSSGDMTSLHYQSSPWFEKPPIYFWLAEGTVKVFGENEFALRLPSALFGLLGLWLIWLITKKLTGSPLAATLAFFILLFSPPYYYYSREVRLDTGLVASILLAIYSAIMGWEKEKYLLLLFPAIAAGIMTKSAPALLAVPVILIFCAFFHQWRCLKSRYLWWGLLPAGVIVVPWHIIQTVRFGSAFWDDYFMRHIFQRGLHGLSDRALVRYDDYLKQLWSYYQPWSAILPVLGLGSILLSIKNQARRRLIYASLASAFFILVIFTVARMHLFTYLLPLYPLAAIAVAVMLYDITCEFAGGKIPIIILTIICLAIGGLWGTGTINIFVGDVIKSYNYEERDVGLVLHQANSASEPVYLLQWPHIKALEYYSGQPLKNTRGDGKYSPPFYLLAPWEIAEGFFDAQGNLLPGLADVEIVHAGQRLLLLHSKQEIQLGPSGVRTFIPD